jgi:hypothetical protein
MESIMSEHEIFLKRDMHLALYGMLLVASGEQPEVRLQWFEIISVELGADEYDAYLATL